MKPAETLPKLKRRIDDYLWRDNGMPLQRLREILATKFEPLGPAAIIGGLIRDIARRGKVGFRSDIDLVVDAAPARVTAFAASLNATPNRFGGFSYIHPHWKIDFWSLPNTWAASVGLVCVNNLADLVNTTFFDCDAICYEIGERKIHALPGYLERLVDRKIEVNLLPNPSIEGNLLRAVRRILLWDFRAGPILRAFIDRELNEYSFKRITHKEKLLHANAILHHFNDFRNLSNFLFDDNRPAMFTALGEQMEIPGLMPPPQ